jgi:hypothetical protein
MYFSAPAFLQAIREGAPPRDLLTIGGPFLIGCVTLLGTFASFRQQAGGRQHWS